MVALDLIPRYDRKVHFYFLELWMWN